MMDRDNGKANSTVVIKPKRARPIRQRHPWIFSGAIKRFEGDVADGDVVDVRDSGGNWLARGTLNRRSQIAVRLLTWDENESIDAAFWESRIAQALAARQPLADDPANTAYRLIHAESDYLPGLIVDQYGDWLIAQFLTLGMDRRKEEIITALTSQVTGLRGIYQRSDEEVRKREGLKPETGLLWGEEPPRPIEIVENDLRFLVDVHQGHKSGYYLDQRENHARFPAFCQGAEVLDAFAYTGAFSTHAALGGAAHVCLVESSAPALDLAQRNLALNGVHRRAERVEGNVFSVLRGYRAQGRLFDVIVLDPPKFAHREHQVKKAARAYKDINLLAFQLLRPSGVLFTFSCSGAVSPNLFQKIVFSAAVDAECPAQIIGTLTQGADHPVALTFPEGAYLKGLIVRTSQP